MRTAKFVSGSTLRHMLVMTGTSTIGLLAVFGADLINIFFLSLLDAVEPPSAVGYASAITFFTISVCIGLSIAASALVAQALGAGGAARARRYVVNVGALTLLITVPLSLAVTLGGPVLLRLLGAEGRTFELALGYLNILVPSTPLLALALVAGGVLRALGDARRGMYATLFGAVVNAALDPLLIFVLDMGVNGAAVAAVFSRVAMLAYGGYVVIRGHRLIGRFQRERFAADLRPMLAIALPAIFTNIATPIGQAYVTGAMARFGDEAVAGLAVISRLVPVAFAGLFAMSGAVGPIIGQNFGAGRIDRVRGTLHDALLVAAGYTLLVSLLLLVGQDLIADLFQARGGGAELLSFYCTWIAVSFFFVGATFVTNAAFNNLGYAYLATGFNFGKATIGTVPFVAAGAAWYGAPGVLIGQAVGGVVFGVGGIAAAFWLIGRLARKQPLAVAAATGS